jgi:hypothetical protein
MREVQGAPLEIDQRTCEVERVGRATADGLSANGRRDAGHRRGHAATRISNQDQQPGSATRISNQDQQQGSVTRFSNRRRAVSDSPRGRIEGRPGRAIPLVVHLIDQPLLVLADPILELLCGTHGGT